MPKSLHDRVRACILERRLLRAGDRVGVAVSGGADSVALLRLLLELRDELGLVLELVHFNHRIRGADADADQDFVRDLAQTLGVEFHVQSGDAPAHAQQECLSLETAARNLRYQYLETLLGSGVLDRVATAHTLDDQAETVLMRLVRGAWTRGLAGIYPELGTTDVTADSHGSKRISTDRSKTIVRPLLEVRREELRAYLRSLGQDWREDASNQNVAHLRNRVRHVLLPLLERDFNPGICDVLGGLAEIARGEEDYWRDELARRPLPDRTDSGGIQLGAEELLGFPLAWQRRLVHDAANQLGFQSDFQTVAELLGLLSAPQPAVLDLGGGWIAVVKTQHHGTRAGSKRRVLEFRQRQPQQELPSDYEYRLAIPGEVYISETGQTIIASLVAGGDAPNQNSLLNPSQFGSNALRVRNWRPGDRFWAAHSRSPKKVKELLQSRHVAGRERALWAVVVNPQDELVWMKDFGVAQDWLALPDMQPAIQIVSSTRTG